MTGETDRNDEGCIGSRMKKHSCGCGCGARSTPKAKKGEPRPEED